MNLFEFNPYFNRNQVLLNFWLQIFIFFYLFCNKITFLDNVCRLTKEFFLVSLSVDMKQEEALKSASGGKDYRFGFVSDVETETIAKGLNQDTIRLISKKKNEPHFMLEWRLKAYELWKKMKEPQWANLNLPKIDFQAMTYFAAPVKKALGSIDEVDPEIRHAFEKLGIPLEEQKRLSGVAIDAVMDSVSVATMYQEQLKEIGVVFCSISEAVHQYPDLIKKYFGSVVPASDNFYTALNAAVFSDGSFIYVPKGVKCPIDLSTYFRINTKGLGQFERTLIIAEEDSFVSYLEGCTAPMRDEHQLHAAVVELIALDDAEIKYSTVQNWYPGNSEGRGGILNYVTKRGLCQGKKSKITWTQLEVGSAITWKYPSCILKGDESVGEFLSVAITTDYQQADTGAKMYHIGKNTKSKIISKGISAGKSQNTYRGLVKVHPTAEGAKSYSQCDSLLIGSECGAHTFPTIDASNSTAKIEHEASTSRVGEEQLLYLQSRGLSKDEAVGMISTGFCHEVLAELPLEFAAEARALMDLKMEGSVG